MPALGTVAEGEQKTPALGCAGEFPGDGAAPAWGFFGTDEEREMKRMWKAAGDHWLAHFARCVWWLGPWLGWRYFRLERRACRDPRLVLVWCAEMERAAAEDEAAGKTVEAAMLRRWAAKCRHYNANFHSRGKS